MPNRIIVSLAEDPDGLGDEFAAWMHHHAETAVQYRGIEASQYFRLEPANQVGLPDRPGSPQYRNLIIYEVSEDYERPDPDAPLPDPPGGLGPNRPAIFLFEPISERYVATD